MRLAIFLCFELILKNPSGLIAVDSDHLCAGRWRLLINEWKQLGALPSQLIRV